ncbi:hypothetical protein AB6A40_011558 [Gnathostoma spinigerum]|uniref:Uncharacterized protein n=1 Tax=Gnathostoma spinigerum TaxID=75299 RepID=A0ABD6F200_9BILA
MLTRTTSDSTAPPVLRRRSYCRTSDVYISTKSLYLCVTLLLPTHFADYFIARNQYTPHCLMTKLVKHIRTLLANKLLTVHSSRSTIHHFLRFQSLFTPYFCHPKRIAIHITQIFL